MTNSSDKPIDETPYGSLVYLKHYVNLEGVGIFLIAAGIKESPCYRIPNPNSSKERLSEQFKDYLRKKVEIRAGRLDDQLIMTQDSVRTYLETIEKDGYTIVEPIEDKDIEKGKYTVVNPSNKSTLGEAILWILKRNGITSESFVRNLKKPNKLSPKNVEMLKVAKRISNSSLEDILVRALHQRPKDARIQYDFLSYYLPVNFGSKK